LPGTTQQAPYGIAMVEADQVADDTAGSRKLCIVDSGIDACHEDLAGLALDGVNLTRSGQWFTDELSHGTHVAGTIAAVANSIGVVGVLPNRRLNLFIAKVFDASGSAPSSVHRARHARVPEGRRPCREHVARRRRQWHRAARRRPAGSGQHPRHCRGGQRRRRVDSYPAGYASVVSVAAVDAKRKVASFSQFNADVELSGPGVDVLSTVPLAQPGRGHGRRRRIVVRRRPMEGSPRKSASGALADFGLGDKPVAGSMTGKVCLISRGTNSFAEKVVNCQTSGGVGAVVYNNTTGPIDGTLGETMTSIPSVGTTQADGQSMLKQVGQTSTVSVVVTDDVYAYYSGTSMATPHVSGVAALVWSHFTHCTASEIRNSLDLHAADLGDRGRDVHYGFGLVQAKATYDAIATKGCGR
jgi:subtilisin family serine protease